MSSDIFHLLEKVLYDTNFVHTAFVRAYQPLYKIRTKMFGMNFNQLNKFCREGIDNLESNYETIHTHRIQIEECIGKRSFDIIIMYFDCLSMAMYALAEYSSIQMEYKSRRPMYLGESQFQLDLFKQFRMKYEALGSEMNEIYKIQIVKKIINKAE